MTNRYVIPVLETRTMVYHFSADTPEEALRAYEAGEGNSAAESEPHSVRRLTDPQEVPLDRTAYAFAQSIIDAAEANPPVDHTDNVLEAIRLKWEEARTVLRRCEKINESQWDSDWESVQDSAFARARVIGAIAKVAGIKALPSFRDGDEESIAKALAAGIRFDDEANMDVEWSWYVVDTPDDDGEHSGRAVERNGEWRVYYDTAIEALNTETN